jgi:serine/threonine-protein kinase
MAEFEDEVREQLSPELEIVRRLGGGRLSTVFLAREPALQRLVAVKVLHPMATRRTKAMARFRREARALARVSHPNVVSIFRVGDLSGRTPYLVMQYVRGPSLAQRLAEADALSPHEACSVLTAVASALSAVHSHEIVHRDVRPESVLCSEPDDRVLLADFGLAAFLAVADATAQRITTAGHIVTDLEYSAPEFLVGEEPTIASDLYSLGVLAYHILTGEGPHEASTVTGQVQAHLREPPVRLSSRGLERPGGLQELLDACLAKKPAHRPSASEVARLLQSLTGDVIESVPGGAAAPSVITNQKGSDDEPVLVLRVLGGMHLEGAGGEDDHPILRQPKRVALLAYLAMGPEGSFRRRDSLIGLFWPESNPDRARHSLRQALYVLRKEVGARALRTRGDEEVGIDPAVIACDAARFEILAHSGRAAAAMEQYGGELLPGFYVDDAPEFERWLDVERVRLRRLAAQLCWNLVEEAGQRGDHLGAVRRAREAVDLDPFDETSLHRLVELLDLLGDRAGALAAFDHFARRLSEEYAAQPSPETMQLVQRVRSRAR